MAMQVKNLIDELKKLDPEDYVVMSSDPEGNRYSFLEGMAISQKLKDGGVYLAELTEELKEEGYTEDDVREEGINCVVLYPGVDTSMLEAILFSSKGKD